MSTRPELASDVRVCAAGESIVAEGEAGSTMYVVLAGQAGISTARAGQTAVLGPGEFFGEMSVIDVEPRSATVTALEDGTRVLPIDQAQFVYLVAHQPAFALAVMAALSRRMRGVMHGTPSVPAAGRPGARFASDYIATVIRPGLWQLRSRGRTCNAYLIAGRHRTVLVDTGLPSTYPSLAEALRSIGHPPETVDLVVLTHEHADHVGGAAFLPGRPTVAAHTLAANKLELRDDFATVSGVIGEEVASFRVEMCLTEGSIIDVNPYRFDVLHTPGHTSGCLCLVDQTAGMLICGDMFMAGGAMGGIFGSGNISDYVLSLERLKRLRLPLALPGHGRVSEQGEADVAAGLARAQALLRDTRELFKAMRGEAAFDRIMRSVRELNR